MHEQSDLEHPPVAWVPYLASFKAALEKAQKRAAAAASGGGSSSSSSLDGFMSEQQELLSSGKQGSGGPKVAVPVAGKASAKKTAAVKRMRS
jgi:hypothetical protein